MAMGEQPGTDGQSVRVAIASQLPLHRDALRIAVQPFPTRVVQPGTMARAKGHVVLIDRVTQAFEDYLDSAVDRQLPVVVWGGYLHPTNVQELVRRGVQAYVSVIGSRDQLVDAVRTAGGGMSWLPALEPGTAESLTGGEARVLRAYLLDYPSDSRLAVAQRLQISEATLKAHLANVRRRLEEPCGSRISLRRAVVARGWLESRDGDLPGEPLP
ncbi:DNA-binding NarL/FixJ family response regulator [Branchiibius hedensis]|uniref:DNA-binding response regulator, NarL/FixJ family, contains REC and HTH domains n=2 Tax=Branchiibius hedensis TaxID=672460 RepID=A0A2Y8ZNN0_9MICO|nr:DNA-binding NarL/FixJ family response regulator [Branchiibius hedensis]SSA33575.1 DNA-binding response regulator, NarL/FixJ family, contains REC and HTH domains [Branchiibius hedensis]